MIQKIAAASFLASFAWLMVATECRPFLPLVKLIIKLGGAL